MSRILVMSDLHIEFERGGAGPSHPSAAWFALRDKRRQHPGHPAVGPWLGDVRSAIDLVVLAGDIGVGLEGVDYAAQVRRYLDAPVVYVAGNHEFYNSHEMGKLRTAMADKAAEEGVMFLDNGRSDFSFGGQRVAVLGTTLWTDYELDGNSPTDLAWAMRSASEGLNDHVRISLGGELFDPTDAKRLHEQAMRWLTSEMQSIRADQQADRIVVVSHHAPVREANPVDCRSGGVSAAYASDLGPWIDAYAPDAWIWGHTHEPFDGRRGVTRLVSAPRGYVVEPGADKYSPAVVRL